MDTRNKTATEFRDYVSEALARHESSFDQLQNSLQAIMEEIQAMKLAQRSPENPFSASTSLTTTPNFQTDPKLHFPKFSGDDPVGWIYKSTQFFAYRNTPADQKVTVATLHLDGVALQWHVWVTKQKGPLSWQEWKKALLERFGPTEFEDPSESLARLKQTSTVTTYQEEFEKLSNQVDGLPEPYLVSSFVAGLQDDIRYEVKLKQPRTLTSAIGVARLVEQKIKLQIPISPRTSFFPSSVRNSTPVQSDSTPSLLGTSPATQTSLNHNPQPVIRRLTPQETQERRRQNLCYYCDERYVPGHRCSRPQLFMCTGNPVTSGEDLPDMELDGEATSPEVAAPPSTLRSRLV